MHSYQPALGVIVAHTHRTDFDFSWCEEGRLAPSLLGTSAGKTQPGARILDQRCAGASGHAEEVARTNKKIETTIMEAHLAAQNSNAWRTAPQNPVSIVRD